MTVSTNTFIFQRKTATSVHQSSYGPLLFLSVASDLGHRFVSSFLLLLGGGGGGGTLGLLFCPGMAFEVGLIIGTSRHGGVGCNSAVAAACSGMPAAGPRGSDEDAEWPAVAFDRVWTSMFSPCCMSHFPASCALAKVCSHVPALAKSFFQQRMSPDLRRVFIALSYLLIIVLMASSGSSDVTFAALTPLSSVTAKMVLGIA